MGQWGCGRARWQLSPTLRCPARPREGHVSVGPSVSLCGVGEVTQPAWGLGVPSPVGAPPPLLPPPGAKLPMCQIPKCHAALAGSGSVPQLPGLGPRPPKLQYCSLPVEPSIERGRSAHPPSMGGGVVTAGAEKTLTWPDLPLSKQPCPRVLVSCMLGTCPCGGAVDPRSLM